MECPHDGANLAFLSAVSDDWGWMADGVDAESFTVYYHCPVCEHDYQASIMREVTLEKEEKARKRHK